MDAKPFHRWFHRKVRPEELTIEIVEDFGGGPAFLLNYKGQRIGRAFVSIEGSEAELVDIDIQGFYPGWGWLERLLNRGHNFQGRGAGTFLLTSVLDELARRGVRLVKGKMMGGSHLAEWYRSVGFSVNNATGEVSRVL